MTKASVSAAAGQSTCKRPVLGVGFCLGTSGFGEGEFR